RRSGPQRIEDRAQCLPVQRTPATEAVDILRINAPFRRQLGDRLTSLGTVGTPHSGRPVGLGCIARHCQQKLREGPTVPCPFCCSATSMEPIGPLAVFSVLGREPAVALPGRVMTTEPRPNPAHVSAASIGDLSGRRFLIEDIYPIVDGGRYPVKRVAGEPIDVWADIVRDGHEVTASSLVWRREGDNAWRREPMRHYDNDRWCGRFTPDGPGHYAYAIETWTDRFATWRREFTVKRDAGLNVALEAREGRELLAHVRPRDRSAAAVIDQARRSFDQTADAADLLDPA